MNRPKAKGLPAFHHTIQRLRNILQTSPRERPLYMTERTMSRISSRCRLRHLVGTSRKSPPLAPEINANQMFVYFPSSFQWCSHGIYKWQERARRNARPRATSLIEPPASVGPAFENIHQPGGFRRNYVLLRAEEQGLDDPRLTEDFIGTRLYQDSSATDYCTNTPFRLFIPVWTLCW
jgi:hypothetical protein